MSGISEFDQVVLDFMQDDPMTAYYIQSTYVFNPATGENVATDKETAVSAIMLDLTLNSNGLSQKFGTSIIAGDKELYIRPPDRYDPALTPMVVNTTSDRVRVGNITYKVANMKEANPRGVSILYSLHIRR